MRRKSAHSDLLIEEKEKVIDEGGLSQNKLDYKSSSFRIRITNPDQQQFFNFSKVLNFGKVWKSQQANFLSLLKFSLAENCKP